MDNTEQIIFKQPVINSQLKESKSSLTERIHKLHSKVESFLIGKGYALVIIAFLLGRALILSQLTPFALPFYAAVYLKYRERSTLVAISLIFGSATITFNNAIYTSLLIIVLYTAFRITKEITIDNWKVVPILTFITILVGKLSFGFFINNEITIFLSLLAAVEATLAIILTYIFLQSMPLLTSVRRGQALKTEEIISLIIMLASVLTGTIGWQLYGLSIEHIMARYLVLIFGLVAGATIGSTVGVVTGLIFSLANISSFFQMSLLAFAGLLGGLLKEMRKLGVSVGLIVATLLIGMYGEGSGTLGETMLDSSVAIILLLITPTTLIKNLAKHIPGTTEYINEQQQYVRKVRDITAQRVAKFSTVFQALSNSFSQFDNFKDMEDPEREIDLFLSNVTEKTCQTCHKKEYCWSKNFTKTYGLMAEIMYELERDSNRLPNFLAMEWRKYCIRSDKIINATKEQLTFFKANKELKKQVQESRRLVAEQLQGVSEVMGDFALEIQREREVHHFQEEQIYNMFQEFGIKVEQIEIYSLERGNIDIDITVPFCHAYGECDKLIAPMLSNILEEAIIPHGTDCSEQSSGYCFVTFKSAKKFTIDTGVAHAAKGGGLLSGDSYSTVELSSGKYALAISDGMGNGERAYKESYETLQLLQKILQSGIEEKIAIKSINSILSLRTTDEIFSTLDLALIDLQDASAKFLKISSIPSFIKRGDKVLKVEASNLPIGILHDFDVDVVNSQFKSGDILIMMSDGVFEGPNLIENNDMWMKRKINELETNNPQEIADLIIEEVIRARNGEIHDDMTVVVAKVKHNIPKWAPIRVSSLRNKLTS